MYKKIFCLLTLIVTLYYISVNVVFAQANNDLSQGIAIDIEIDAKDVPNGSIISLDEGKYKLSSSPYDGSVFGVSTKNPSVAFIDVANKNKWSVVTMGKTLVRVTTLNGEIKAGDVITTSSLPGVGQKATENGYVIGIAQDDYSEADPNKVGTIYATLHLNYGLLSSNLRENLLDSILKGSRAPLTSPLNALRYLVAGIIAFVSFGSGFWFFGKVSSRGVEAVGRNPLARKFILISVVLNVLLTIGVMLCGVALAYLILVI